MTWAGFADKSVSISSSRIAWPPSIRLEAVPDGASLSNRREGIAHQELLHRRIAHAPIPVSSWSKRKKLTLGSTKRMTLADARALAGKQRSQLEAGEDPHDEKLEAKRKEKELIQQQAEVQHLDVELMWEKYMKIVASQLRSRDEKDRGFRRYILPTVKDRCVNEITKTHALKIFETPCSWRIDPLCHGVGAKPA